MFSCGDDGVVYAHIVSLLHCHHYLDVYIENLFQYLAGGEGVVVYGIRSHRESAVHFFFFRYLDVHIGPTSSSIHPFLFFILFFY